VLPLVLMPREPVADNDAAIPAYVTGYSRRTFASKE